MSKTDKEADMISPIAPARRTPHDEEVLARDEVEIYVVDGCEGPSLAINDLRVAGPKPWGGGNITRKWKSTRRDVLRSLALEERPGDDDRLGHATALLRLIELATRLDLGPVIVGQYEPGEWDVTLHDEVHGDCPRYTAETLDLAVAAALADIAPDAAKEPTS